MSDVGLLGWITQRLIAHDQHARGLIARVLGASTQNRQSIYAALAHEELNGIAPDTTLGQSDFDAVCERAMRLRNCPALEIISAVYGNVPEGFLGALARCGAEPLKPDHYQQLFEIYSTPQPAKLNALKYVDQITRAVMDVIATLAPVLLHPKVVRSTADSAAASQLNDALACVQKLNSQATNEAIQDAIRQMSEAGTISSVLMRFARRADQFPPQPLVGVDGVRPLDSVPLLIAAGRKYQNCLPTHVSRALLGLVAFAEFQDETILEFRPLSNGGWLLEDVHVEQNGRVADADRAAAQELCAHHGIAHVSRIGNPPPGWRSMESLFRRHHWDAA